MTKEKGRGENRMDDEEMKGWKDRDSDKWKKLKRRSVLNPANEEDGHREKEDTRVRRIERRKNEEVRKEEEKMR